MMMMYIIVQISCHHIFFIYIFCNGCSRRGRGSFGFENTIIYRKNTINAPASNMLRCRVIVIIFFIVVHSVKTSHQRHSTDSREKALIEDEKELDMSRYSWILNKIDLNKYPDAVCLDGTPGGYWFRFLFFVFKRLLYIISTCVITLHLYNIR